MDQILDRLNLVSGEVKRKFQEKIVDEVVENKDEKGGKKIVDFEEDYMRKKKGVGYVEESQVKTKDLFDAEKHAEKIKKKN